MPGAQHPPPSSRLQQPSVSTHGQRCPGATTALDGKPLGLWLLSDGRTHRFYSDFSFKKKKVKVKVAQSCRTLCDPVQSMEFSRPEYWSGFPSPGDLPIPGIRPSFSGIAGGFFTVWASTGQILYSLSQQQSPDSCLVSLLYLTG